MAVKNAKPAKRVFLIDSMSHIFRAFYAPMANRAAPLANSHGQVTQAVFIFTNMLRKLLLDEQPDYIAAIFESGEKTFRHETFADYKANRLQMPEDLASQLPFIIRLCEAFNIPVINAPGYEADDVIGTLAAQAERKGVQAVIVSNDKDMCQLVHDPFVVAMRTNSQVVRRKEYVPPIEWCDEAWVEKKFGVTADQVVDLLVGDDAADEEDVGRPVLPAGDRDGVGEPTDIDAIGDDLVVAGEEPIDEVAGRGAHRDAAVEAVRVPAQDPPPEFV